MVVVVVVDASETQPVVVAVVGASETRPVVVVVVVDASETQPVVVAVVGASETHRAVVVVVRWLGVIAWGALNDYCGGGALDGVVVSSLKSKCSRSSNVRCASLICCALRLSSDEE